MSKKILLDPISPYGFLGTNKDEHQWKERVHHCMSCHEPCRSWPSDLIVSLLVIPVVPLIQDLRLDVLPEEISLEEVRDLP